jgi:Polyketide cyclase / dehydrase and lipid transport
MPETDDRNSFRVERSIAIAAPADRIYPSLSDFHRWTEWSPWEGLDPDLQRRYGGPDEGVGATYEWEGNRKAGKGRMEIVAADPPAGLAIDLQFIKPFKSQSRTRFDLRTEGDTTTVTWSMKGPKTFATRIMGVFTSMDKLIGRDFEKGLTRLKATTEG